MQTFFCWKHSGDGAEGSFSTVVESTHFNVKGWEWGKRVIAENISCRIGGGGHCPRPGNCAHWSKGNNVAKTISILKLLWDRLGVEHKTVVILKRIETSTQAASHILGTTTSTVTTNAEKIELKWLIKIKGIITNWSKNHTKCYTKCFIQKHIDVQ